MRSIKSVIAQLGCLYGTQGSQTSYALAREVVDSLKVDWRVAKVLDPACGHGIFLLAALEKMVEAGDTIPNAMRRLYGYETNHNKYLVTRSALTKIGGVDPNVRYMDPLEIEPEMKFDVIVGNPPYQPMKGVKKGGGLFEKFLEFSLEHSDRVAMIVPFTWQTKVRSSALREKMVKNGLKEIKHLPPDTFKANVLTETVILEKGYEGPISQVVYGVSDKSESVTLLDREDYASGDILPVVRNTDEEILHRKFMQYSNNDIAIYPNTVKNKGWAVEYSYLIGMQKEKLNIENPLRCIRVIGPDTPQIDRTANYYHIPVETPEDAEDLCEYLKTVGQKFFRTIPRGSSMERWMVSIVVAAWQEAE